MDSHNAEDWLRLVRAPGFGSRRLAELLSERQPSELVRRPPTRLAGALAEVKDDQIAADLEWLAEPSHHLITRDQPIYPQRLGQLDDPPVALFAVGDPEFLARPQLAIVGSRNPTPGGLDNAREFASHLSNAGLTITSGLALGIDGAAHEGALLGPGGTVALIGTGADRIYPARHLDLAREISANGAVVSEFPLGTKAKPGHFPRRNRLISGLSLGVLVVEATPRSGSLITARTAMEQGREVFAIPGSIHNPLARGCHQLIRQGAKLVETAADILEELGPLIPGSTQINTNESARDDSARQPDGDYSALLDALGHDPVTPDELGQRTGLSAREVSSMLLLLELEGRVSSGPGGRFTRR